jgi:hypothetical protein
MKKLTVLFLVICLTGIMTGCGVKNKIEQKVGEKVAEKVLESAGGGDVDISEEGISFTDEEGKEVSFGGTKWPSDIDYLPEFDKGTILSVIKSSEGSVFIIVQEVKEADFLDYYEDIKEAYAENPYELTINSATTYTGTNGEGFAIQLTYSPEEETLSLGVEKTTE